MAFHVEDISLKYAAISPVDSRVIPGPMQHSDVYMYICICICIKDKEKSSWGLKKLRADSSRNFGSAIRSSISGTISRERSVSRRDFSSRSFYASIFIRGSWIRRGSRVRKLYRSQEKKLDIEYTHEIKSSN